MIHIQEPAVYEHVIHYDEEKLLQVRISISTFKNIEHLHIRRYYMDFEEEWRPSLEGISMPLDFNNSRELFRALTEIISLAESKEIIKENFEDLLKDIYNEEQTK